MNVTMCSRGFLAPLAALALLAGCSSDEAPPRAAKVAQRNWVSEIRAAAAASQSAVQVSPLADAEVEDLRAKARRLEANGRYDRAQRALERALKLRPQDPTLWQALAEISLQRGEWAKAEQHAQHAYDLGPKLGELCIRNWLTVHASRAERGLAADADSAKQQVPNCEIAAPVRM